MGDLESVQLISSTTWTFDYTYFSKFINTEKIITMDYIILYASGLIVYQTIQTIEQRRAIPHLKELIADIHLSSRASLASNGIKL
jgi:hypothetical protein